MDKYIEESCGKTLIQTDPTTYVIKSEYGVRMATITPVDAEWQIQWDGRWLGLFDNPIQAFRGLALHCIC